MENTLTAESVKNMNIAQIAGMISRDWSKTKAGINFAAKPYLQAMFSLNSIGDRYINDSGKEIVLYFLSNASSYRGETAKILKAELKLRLKG